LLVFKETRERYLANNMNNKPILYSYFKKSADILLSEYNRSKEQSAPSNLGKNREYFCKEFLSKVLPPKLFIHSGEIWDSQKNKTGQLDIVILRDDAPSLHIGSDDIYLAEGVFAVIEVKSNLTREKIIEAGESLIKVADLKINVGAQITSGAVLDRPLRIVFAYEGSSWDIIKDEINKNNWSDVFDLICILNRGALINKGRLVSWDTEEDFSLMSGEAACLGCLYLYLVTYGTGFLGRGMRITPYFEPFNNWSDN